MWLQSSHSTYHVWLPQRFTHAVHLLWTGAAHNEVFCHHGAANQIQGADEGLKGFGIQSSDHRLDVVWPKPNERRAYKPQTKSSFTYYVNIFMPTLCCLSSDYKWNMGLALGEMGQNHLNCAHLLSYNRLDTMLMKVLGLIWRPSFSSYRFSLNLSLWDLHTKQRHPVPPVLSSLLRHFKEHQQRM